MRDPVSPAGCARVSGWPQRIVNGERQAADHRAQTIDNSLFVHAFDGGEKMTNECEKQIKKVGDHRVEIFKIKNRRGFAAACEGHLTEGDTSAQAMDRMVKALSRTARKGKKV